MKIAIGGSLTANVNIANRGGNLRRAVAWSPDGHHLASASEDNTVHLWDAGTGNLGLIYRGHAKWVYSVAWSPDGEHLASGSYDHQVHIWNARSGEVVFVSPKHRYCVSALAWSPDGRRMAVGHGNRVESWEVETGSNPISYERVWGAVEDVAWSPDGRYLAAASAGSRVQVWDGASGSSVFIYRGDTSYLWSLAWLQDGQRLAFGTGSTHVQKNEPRVHAAWAEVWDIATKTRLLSYHGFANVIGGEMFNPNFVSAIAWSPDGEQIATAYGGEVQVWGAADGVQRFSYIGHRGWIGCLAWSPNGQHIALGGGEKTVHVWQLE